MAAYASGRNGLAIRVQPGDRGGSDDFNQLADALLAGKRVLADLLGGEAIYAGGASVLADLTGGGKNYPAVTVVVADDSGNPWPFKTTSVTAIEFGVTSTAAGAARLYAVPVTMTGVSPAAADGRYHQVRFVADDVANPAPAHSLLLGSGTIAASAFTAYTPASTAPAESQIADASTTVKGKVKLAASGGTTAGTVVQASDTRLSDARTPTAHASSHKHGGTDEVATATPAANAIPKADSASKLDAWITDASTSAKGKVQLATSAQTTAGLVVQASDTRLSDARTPTAHAASHAAAGSDPLSGYALLAAANSLSARNTFTNGLLAMVRDTKFGSPASGTYVAGDCWIDRSGAIWYCVTGGTPGTWEQMTSGICGTWTGASAADITTAANWNGGALLSGYRVYDSTSGEQQVYTYNGAVWLGGEFTVPMQPYAGWSASGYSATASSVFQFIMSPLHDIIVTGHQADIHGTADASNRWELDLFYLGGMSLGTLVKNSSSSYWVGTPTATVLNYNTHRALYCTLTKVGTPGNCTALANNITCRYVRR